MTLDSHIGDILVVIYEYVNCDIGVSIAFYCMFIDSLSLDYLDDYLFCS